MLPLWQAFLEKSAEFDAVAFASAGNFGGIIRATTLDIAPQCLSGYNIIIMIGGVHQDGTIDFETTRQSQDPKKGGYISLWAQSTNVKNYGADGRIMFGHGTSFSSPAIVSIQPSTTNQGHSDMLTYNERLVSHPTFWDILICVSGSLKGRSQRI